jgi:hypothetical protein
MMPTYPARPRNGGYLKEELIHPGYIYRPKLDGDRVLLNTYTEEMHNRHGERYTKGKDIRIDCIREYIELLGINSPWVDIEFLNKHKRWKGMVAIIDVPFRDFTFGELIRKLDSNPLKQANRGILPLSAYDHTKALSVWLALQGMAKRYMEQDKESTPIIEGLVGVQADSMYPVQIRNPKEQAANWVKHRFSN